MPICAAKGGVGERRQTLDQICQSFLKYSLFYCVRLKWKGKLIIANVKSGNLYVPLMKHNPGMELPVHLRCYGRKHFGRGKKELQVACILA